MLPDGPIGLPDGPIGLPNGSIGSPNGPVRSPDGPVRSPVRHSRVCSLGMSESASEQEVAKHS